MMLDSAVTGVPKSVMLVGTHARHGPMSSIRSPVELGRKTGVPCRRGMCEAIMLDEFIATARVA